MYERSPQFNQALVAVFDAADAHANGTPTEAVTIIALALKSLCETVPIDMADTVMAEAQAVGNKFADELDVLEDLDPMKQRLYEGTPEFGIMVAAVVDANVMQAAGDIQEASTILATANKRLKTSGVPEDTVRRIFVEADAADRIFRKQLSHEQGEAA